MFGGENKGLIIVILFALTRIIRLFGGTKESSLGYRGIGLRDRTNKGKENSNQNNITVPIKTSKLETIFKQVI